MWLVERAARRIDEQGAWLALLLMSPNCNCGLRTLVYFRADASAGTVVSHDGKIRGC